MDYLPLRKSQIFCAIQKARKRKAEKIRVICKICEQKIIEGTSSAFSEPGIKN
jgi:hypothetical protein